MKISKAVLFFCFLLGAFYIATLFYLTQNYSEDRWIPKSILSIPRIVENDLLSKQSDADFLAKAPAVLPPEKNVLGFQVLFDNSALPNIQMQNAWEAEKNARKTYAKPITDEGLPKLAIILTGVGLDEDLFADAVSKLPSVVTLSFSPYADDLAEKITYVRRQGFENMMDIVVEGADGFDNGGALALRTGQSLPSAEKILQENYFDLNVPFTGFWVNTKAPFDDKTWAYLQQKADTYGLMLLSPDNVDWVGKDNFYASAITELLMSAEAKAALNGHFILVLPMHPSVVEAIVNQVGMQVHSDVAFVPASAIKEQ